jgi:peptidoglycan-N-acetylglucosamine deacetylase
MSYKNPLRRSNSSFIEICIPMTTLELPLIGNIPVGGGHYFRFLPPNILKTSVKKFNKCGFPAIFYIHPHELDSAKPCVTNAAWHNYWGLKEATDKFNHILSNFRFLLVHDLLAL